MNEIASSAGRVGILSRWRGVHARAIVPYVLLAIGLVLVIAIVGTEARSHVDTFERWLRGVGAWGPLAFVVLFVVGASLFMPYSVMVIMAGALFGMWWGVLAVIVGSVLANALQYAMARSFLGRWFERRTRRQPKLHRLVEAVRHDQVRLQFIVRLTPLSTTLVSYVFGAGRVRFLPFMLAMSAKIPGYFFQTYLGVAGKSAIRMPWRSGEVSSTKVVLIGVGLLACGVVMFFIGRAALHAIERVIASTREPMVERAAIP